MASKARQSGLNAAMHTSGLYSDMSLDGPEIGTLVVVVDRAKNLPSRRSMGKQDPYCAARLGKEAKKTSTDRRGGQTPRWDQELRFTVRDSPDYLTLKISVFNDDKKTELIGENFLRLDDVIVAGGGEAEMWHNLSCKGKYAGEVRLELTYYDTRPKAEKPVAERRRERSNTESPAIAGSRQTPVKRRPLPSDPVVAQHALEPEHDRPRPLPQATGGTYQTPPRQAYAGERNASSNRRTAYNQLQPTPVEYRGPPSQAYSHQESAPEDPFTLHAPRSDYEPSLHPSEGFDQSYGYPHYEAAQTQDQVVNNAPYPMHDGPPVVSLGSSQHERRNTGPAPAPLSHSNSEPIVPYFQHEQHRHSLHHTVSETRVGEIRQSHGTHYEHMPAQSEHHNYYHEPSNYDQQDEMHSPLHRGYHDQTDYSLMQPSVEDEDSSPPPPPPTHGNSARASVAFQRGSVGRYSMDLAPGPLNITPSRTYGPPDAYSSPNAGRAEGSPQPDMGSHSSMPPSYYTHDQGSSYGTPERRETTSLAMQHSNIRDPLDVASTAYSSPPDVQRRALNQSHRMSLPQHVGSSPPAFAQQSPYQTPPRGAHPLATQQNVTYGSSPTAPLQYSPADAAPAPLIKPRPVSPAAEQHHEHSAPMMRPAVNVNFVRKSVPTQSTSRAPDASTPFSPDSFDAFNPNARKPATSGATSTYSTPPRSQHGSFSESMHLDQSVRQSPFNETDATDGTPIHDMHGNVIDPSDRLPVNSWAPEPERKGFSFKPQITPRDRDRLTGARSMGNSPAGSFNNGESPNELNGSFSMSTRSDISSQVSAGSSLLATVGSSRAKLQKKSRPQSEFLSQTNSLHGPGQSLGSGNYPYVNAVVKRASNDFRASGGAPPIPAKVPLDNASVAGDMDKLNLELASIDIGPSSNAMVRRPRRLGY